MVSINSATNIDELNAVKVKLLLSSAEALLTTLPNNGESNSNQTDIPNETDTQNATDITVEINAEETTTATEEKITQTGCRSTISSIVIMLAVLIIGSIAIIPKTKEG